MCFVRVNTIDYDFKNIKNPQTYIYKCNVYLFDRSIFTMCSIRSPLHHISDLVSIQGGRYCCFFWIIDQVPDDDVFLLFRDNPSVEFNEDLGAAMYLSTKLIQ